MTWPLATASKKSRVRPEDPAGDQVEHQQEGEVGEGGEEAAAQSGEGGQHEGEQARRQRSREGEAAQHEVQPEVDERAPVAIRRARMPAFRAPRMRWARRISNDWNWTDWIFCS